MTNDSFNGKGTTVGDNRPVGSAGQPNPFGNIKKEVPDKKKAAIQRRMKKKQSDTGKKN